MSDSANTEQPPTNNKAKIAARLSFWSPFAACLTMAPIVAFSELWGINPRWAVWTSFGIFCLLILSGFVLGGLALAWMRKHGRNGVLGRAVTGVCLNLVLICLICSGLPTIADEEVAQRERTAAEARQADPVARAELSLLRLSKLEASVAKESRLRTNDDVILFRALSEVLRNEQTNMSNYFAATRPLMYKQILNMAGIQSPAGLSDRQALVLRFFQANTAMSNYCVSASNNFRAGLINGGYPKSKLDEAAAALGTNLTKLSKSMPIWEANHRWAEGELQGLGLLSSNWSNWSYDGSVKKVVFKTKDVQTKFDDIVHEINAAYKERTRYQQQLQRDFHQN